MFDINPSLPMSPGLAPVGKAPIEDDCNRFFASDFVNAPYGSELNSWLQEDVFELEDGHDMQAQQEASPSQGSAIQPLEKTRIGENVKYCEEKEMMEYQNMLGEELFSSTTPGSASKEYSNSHESTLLISKRNSSNLLDSHDATLPMPEDLDSLNLRLVIAQSQMQLRLKGLGLDAPGEDLDEALLDSQYMALKLYSARLKSNIKRIVHDAGEGALQANALEDANPLTIQSGTEGVPAIGLVRFPGPHSHHQHVAVPADQLSSPTNGFQCPDGMPASLSGDEVASASFDESFPVSRAFVTSRTPSAPSQQSFNLCTGSPQAVSDSVSSKRRSAVNAGFFDCFDSIQIRSKRQRTVKTATENRSLVSADGGSCVRCKHLGLPVRASLANFSMLHTNDVEIVLGCWFF